MPEGRRFVSSGKTIAILQSNYIPWKGYFDLMAAVDEFLIFDEAQFTKRDWRNRNRTVTNGGTSWLTIPVRTAGRLGASIDSIEIADHMGHAALGTGGDELSPVKILPLAWPTSRKPLPAGVEHAPIDRCQRAVPPPPCGFARAADTVGEKQ